MQNYSFDTIYRITKSIARKYYNAGVDVLFCPCKMHPENKWYNMAVTVNKLKCDNRLFDNVVNEFEYYSCNAETGRYTAFYIKKRL